MFRFWFGALSVLVFVSASFAADITIDFNGFLNRNGGQVAIVGVDKPVRWEAGAKQLVLKDVPAGARCSVDFFHNSGQGSSDFSFILTDAGDGIASVGLGGGVHEMLDGFNTGDTTLKLRTFDIVYNANRGQTAPYFIAGLIDAHSLPAGRGPQTLRAVPGTYSVDNLHNSGGGNEDYLFIVDDQGRTSGFIQTVHVYEGEPRKEIVERRWQRDGNEYATYDGANVNPRSALVHFSITATGNVLIHPTHEDRNVVRDGNNVTFDMPLTIGSGGINISSFGQYTIDNSNVIMPDGNPAKGGGGANDYKFIPRLRYAEDKGFYFDTTDGPSQTVHGQATGYYDGNVNELSVTVTATIVEPEPATTQPATQPAE